VIILDRPPVVSPLQQRTPAVATPALGDNIHTCSGRKHITTPSQSGKRAAAALYAHGTLDLATAQAMFDRHPSWGCA
jgi:hypothetical protein